MHRRIVLATLCCSLVLTDVAQAGPSESDGQRTRSVFVGTIAAMVAQGVGSALAQGLKGAITHWFESKPPAPREPARLPAVRPHAGLAYEVHAIAADGSARAVDPASHVFRTGDRFQVHYRPTLPGHVRVLNTDPKGHESAVDDVRVAAGELATLGPYRFVEGRGRETLTLTLQPCSSPALTAATRRIVKAEDARGPAAPARLAACDGGALREAARARTIAKVTADGTTRFALEPLSDREQASGVVAAREVRIVLRHE